MANVDAPFGAVPIGTTDGSDYHGKLRQVQFAAGDSVVAFLGDFVKLTGEGSTDGKIPVVARGAENEDLVGAIVSFDPLFSDEGSLSSAPNHRTASVQRNAWITWGTQVLYEIQADELATALTAGDIGRNVDLTAGTTGSTITGISAMEIDSDSVDDATKQFRLHSVANKVGNSLGSTKRKINLEQVYHNE
jgi:hypothetical protein